MDVVDCTVMNDGGPARVGPAKATEAITANVEMINAPIAPDSRLMDFPRYDMDSITSWPILLNWAASSVALARTSRESPVIPGAEMDND